MYGYLSKYCAALSFTVVDVVLVEREWCREVESRGSCFGDGTSESGDVLAVTPVTYGRNPTKHRSPNACN